MLETKAGSISISKTSLINAYNIQSNSLLQYLEYNLNKHSPYRQYIYNQKMKEQELEQKWQHQFLRQLQDELNADQPAIPYFNNKTQIEYRGDRLSKQINLGTVQKAIVKSKKKEFQKYKAYATKLKIPSFNELYKQRPKEDKSNFISKDKNTMSSAYFKQIQELINPKLARSLKETNKEHIKARNYQSINDKQVFKRNAKSSQNQRNVNIRKRSVKHAEKKEEHQIQNEIQKSNQCSPVKAGNSIKGLKKTKKVSERSTATPYFDSKNFEFKERDKSEGKNRQIQIRQIYPQDKCINSPKMLIQKSEIAKIDYLQKGINFKRREKESLKEVQNLNEKKISSILNKRITNQGSIQHMNQRESKEIQVVVRQTPRNFLLQSLILPKGTKMRKAHNIDQSKSVSKQQRFSKQIKINKIIVFNSEDKYIRRILLALGWVLNPDTKSKFYHLKWVFKPSSEDYNMIREGQYINHIKNSHQLTSKHCLNKNLKNYFSQWTNLYDFYPQCYDISKPAEKQQFFADYTKQFMMLLLRKIYTYIQKIQSERTLYLRLKYQKLLREDGLYSTDTKMMSFMRKKQFRNIEMQNYKCFRSNFTLHINLLTAALKYWRFLRKQQEIEEEEDSYHFLDYSQKEFQINMGYLERYSQMSTPTYLTDNLQYFNKEFYSTPSNIVIERIVKEYVYFRKKYSKKWSIFGDGNVWIIKPCSASRGNGIYLQNNCKQILFNSKGIQSRIVQKYIEKPLLFRNKHYPQICNKKFDIRQWVLLRSVDPLQIHMFSHCYVRICSQEYNIENINNLKCHLTNYSFNKQHFKDPAESVLDYDTFKSLLMQEYKVNYEKQIKEKIKQIIIKSIKSAQQLLNDFGKRCFSLLGYDILLDQNFNPWLLEVNMSPACQQRTEWLKNYLKEMGKGMLQIVLPKQYLQIQKEIDPLQNVPFRQKQKRIDSNSKNIMQLKRIKTEITHEFKSQLQQNKSNLNFNQSKATDEKWEDKHIQMEQPNYTGNMLYQQQQQITYQDFIKQNLMTQEECFNLQQIYRMQGLEKIEINQERDTIQNTFQNNRINKNKNIRIASQISLPAQPSLKSQSPQMQVESDYQEANYLQIANQLRWELICFEEYHGKRKQIDGLLEINGMRMTNEFIRSNDTKIDLFQETRDEILTSIIKIQSIIKAYLKRKQIPRLKKYKEKVQQTQVNEVIVEIHQQNIQNQEKQQNLESPIRSETSLEQKEKDIKKSLKLNFQNIILLTKTQRNPRSRSVIDGELDSIWHYSYVHTYRQGVIEKVQVVKNELIQAKRSPKQKKIKHFYQNKLRDKNASATLNAVSDVSVSYLQEIILKRNNRQINQERSQQLKSELPLALDKEEEVENYIKQIQSQNVIE